MFQVDIYCCRDKIELTSNKNVRSEARLLFQIGYSIIETCKRRGGVAVIYSKERKLALSGWLRANDFVSYQSPLRLQKFLFLYEAFSRLHGKEADFWRLKGYKRRPVFSAVWGDYTKDRQEFDSKAMEAYSSGRMAIDDRIAARADFIVSSLSERELSDMTQMTALLERMYPDEIVNGYGIIPIGEKFFAFPKEQMNLLTEQHFDTLATLSEKEELHNSVYVEIDEAGRLCVD